jgi:hypothetical protein
VTTPSLFGEHPANCDDCSHSMALHVAGRCMFAECRCGHLSDPTEPHAYLSRQPAETSRAAALAVLPRSGTQRHLVLVSLHLRSMTDDELVQIPGTGTKAGVRRQELVAGGWVEDSGDRRETRSGCDAIVWQLTERARATDLPL